MYYKHIKAKPNPVKIRSINKVKGTPINDLEATLLCFQKLVDRKIKEGKKGIVLYKGESCEYKMSYENLKGFLWELQTYFAMKGAFSFGICGDCEKFGNACSTDGTFGKCGDNDKYMFDSCENFKGSAGFGRE